jgi:hypothetical protein
MATTTVLTSKSLINDQWAHFTCVRGESKITVEHPDGTVRVIKYAPMYDESQLTYFAYGYCYGYDQNKS